MIKKVLKKIGASENLILKCIANFLKFPILIAQLQLLKLHKDREIINTIQKIRKSGSSLMWPTEMAQIYTCVLAIEKLDGDLAEVGVYYGRSAKLICEIKGQKILHLFDTFEGLPKPTSKDSSTMLEKMYFADLDSVKAYLRDYDNVFFYPGLFPATAEPIEDKSFAFVHLDVDLYQSTLDCLKFFYPRMVRGGLILSHNYSNLDGVRKAFDEFFTDMPESVIELSTSQCIVVKQSAAKAQND